MKIRLLLIPSLLFLLTATTQAQQDTAALIGRWDMTITTQDGKLAPSWFEVYRSGYRTLVGEFVGSGGSARPVSLYQFSNGKLNFSIPPQWEQGSGNVTVEGSFAGDSLTGTITYPDGKQNNWSAVHAPELKRTETVSWGQPQKL